MLLSALAPITAAAASALAGKAAQHRSHPPKQLYRFVKDR
jgi:hypothetical protein